MRDAILISTCNSNRLHCPTKLMYHTSNITNHLGEAQ